MHPARELRDWWLYPSIRQSKSFRISSPRAVWQLTEAEVEALPKDLPEYIEVDLSGLEPGGAVMLADIVLPEGVTLPGLTDDEDTNVMVANAIHISESQGTGAAAEAEAAAAEAEAAGEAEPTEAEDAEAADEGGEAEEDKE